MIVSHTHKFIFVKTRKVGGTSLEMALSAHCGPDDILTELEPHEEIERRRATGVTAQNHLWTGQGADFTEGLRWLAGRPQRVRFREHMPAWQIRNELGPELWDDYFTFTIVRNPFDRCVSRFYHCISYVGRDADQELWDRASFGQFVRYRTEMINENWPLYTMRDRPIVDFCVRYEHLEADLAEVSARIGFASNIYDEMKQIRMKGDIRPNKAAAADVIEPQFRDTIATLCEKEIDLFGYGFEDRAPKRPSDLAMQEFGAERVRRA